MNRGIIGGRAVGVALAGADGGATGAGTSGVTGRAGVGGTSGTAVVSPVVRLALATTPGVKTGVGFLRCGGGVKGVAKGMDVRGVGGVGTLAVPSERLGGESNASGAASASDSITARSFAARADPMAGTAAEARAGVGTAAPAIPTRITAPQTEQRARTPPGGTFDGSTRNTD